MNVQTIMNIAGLFFLCMPVVYGVAVKKDKRAVIAAAVVLCVAVAVYMSVSSFFNDLNEETSAIFHTQPLDTGKGNYSERGVDYRDFVFESKRHIKNILLIGTDRQPDQESGGFAVESLYLISIDLDSNALYLISLHLDDDVRYTLDQSGEQSVCRLGEVAGRTGAVQGLVNAIRLNMGLDINEYLIVTRQTLRNMMQVFFPGGIEVPLTELEILGINQSLPSQNLSFGLDEKSSMFAERSAYTSPDDDRLTFGARELAYLRAVNKEQELYDINRLLDEAQRLLHDAESGKTKLGDKADASSSGEETQTDREQALIDLIRALDPERRFDEEHEVLYSLDANELLAYMRMSSPYQGGTDQRQLNTQNLIVQILPDLLGKLSDRQAVKQFAQKCGETEAIVTSYGSLHDLLTDLMFPIKSIHNGKALSESGEAKKSLPYQSVNYTGELYGEYCSMRRQAWDLLYQ